MPGTLECPDAHLIALPERSFCGMHGPDAHLIQLIQRPERALARPAPSSDRTAGKLGSLLAGTLTCPTAGPLIRLNRRPAGGIGYLARAIKGMRRSSDCLEREGWTLKKLGRLSQGMRTRFALALALSHRAELLLLDEPSSGLDPAFRRDLLERLSGIIEGGRTSVLFSNHITSDLDRIADFVTFLRQGRLVVSSTREEVLERWFLVKGGPDLLSEATSFLFAGVVTGEHGFTGLTEKLPELRSQVAEGSMIVERATLEDVVFYTGRTGKEGMRLHGHPS